MSWVREKEKTDPFWPLRMLLTTSLTPLFKHLCSAAERKEYEVIVKAMKHGKRGFRMLMAEEKVTSANKF